MPPVRHLPKVQEDRVRRGHQNSNFAVFGLVDSPNEVVKREFGTPIAGIREKQRVMPSRIISRNPYTFSLNTAGITGFLCAPERAFRSEIIPLWGFLLFFVTLFGPNVWTVAPPIFWSKSNALGALSINVNLFDAPH